MWINPQPKVVHSKLPTWGSTWMSHFYVSFWPSLTSWQAGYVSGMLAPVGIGITGALLIVGALYSIRMIHRKRRNSFKHQRRKVRQPEVNTLFVIITCFSSFACYWGSVLYWILHFLPSNLESPGPAVRTKPCCWPTAPRMSSDETRLGSLHLWPMADAPV